MFRPDTRGFFPIIYQQLENGLRPEDRAAFGALSTLAERIKFLGELEPVRRVLRDLVQPLRGRKNPQRSEENREAGNSQFLAGNYRQALILYSVAVFTAETSPKPGEGFALALANRAACLMKLKMFAEALDDADLALSCGSYPDQKSFKLLERKAQIHEALSTGPDHSAKALEAYSLAVQAVHKATNLSKDKKDTFIASAKTRMAKLEQRSLGEPPDLGGARKTPHRRLLDVKPDERSPRYPAVHRGIRFSYAEGVRGRFAVASEDIPCGTVLVREDPIACTLHPDKFGTNCQHCFAPLRAVIPCPDCVWVCFCSTGCRDAALTSYHRFECPILKHLMESGLNVYAFLTLRALAKAGPQDLMDPNDEDLGRYLRDDHLTRSEDRGCGGDDDLDDLDDDLHHHYHSQDFKNLYSLMAHEEGLSQDEWFLRTLVALFLLRCLEVSQFMSEASSSDWDTTRMSQEAIFLGRIILRLINICPTNCHDVSEMETPVLDTFSPACNKVSLGAAMYVTLALFNHSCNPSFMRCNSGNSVVCVTNRLIRKGEEVFENYGLAFTSKDLAERQKILMDHYKFQCHCPACAGNWPSLVQMKAELLRDPEDRSMARFVVILCQKCGSVLQRRGWSCPKAKVAEVPLSCLVCGSETDLGKDVPLKRIKEESKAAIDLLLKGQWSLGIEKVATCDRLVSKYFEGPTLEMAEAQVAIWKCMWLRFGNMRLVKLF